MALCVKLAILQIGICVIEPSQLPQAVKLKLQPHEPMGPLQQEPTGHAGGAPIPVMSLTTPSLPMPASVPVNPDPEIPPLVVKMVTVCPTWRQRLANKRSSGMCLPPLLMILVHPMTIRPQLLQIEKD